MATKEKTSLEKFIEFLTGGEKLLLAGYSTDKTYERLSKTFDKMLETPHENQETEN